MIFEELKNKANSLPLLPGVYLMQDQEGSIIYVGKAKKLKNRVSQYFQDTAGHSPKTRQMVSKIFDFQYIVANTEFEALVLECSLIKRHMPKYNILLKDDKGFPYLRLDMREKYPTITMVNKPENDGAEYFGPFGSRSVTQSILESIRLAYLLPGCSKKFPRDIGKDRPCLNYHMNQCSGWCQTFLPQVRYYALMEQARQLLLGNYNEVAKSIRENMLDASENMNFELAATLRDRLNAVEALGKKQLVTAGRNTDTDVIGYFQSDKNACFTILHFHEGNLLDKDFEIISADAGKDETVSSLLKQYYLGRRIAPKTILLPFKVEDMELIEQLFSEKMEKRVYIRVPARGDNLRLVGLANQNAKEEIDRITTAEEKHQGAIRLLGKTIGIPTLNRIESFDISNTAGMDIVAGMVVFMNGKPKKGEYKRFKIKDLTEQDDYASMRQALTRRFAHYKEGTAGFDVLPDLLLVDGGANHAAIAVSVLEKLEISVPVYGMVKDNRHRTRALVTPSGDEIAIDHQPALFSLIGNIQEETHRFAITYHRKLRGKKMRYSELDSISGIGKTRKELLLKQFKSISAIASAEMADLQRILPKDVAYSVYQHFHSEEKE